MNQLGVRVKRVGQSMKQYAGLLAPGMKITSSVDGEPERGDIVETVSNPTSTNSALKVAVGLFSQPADPCRIIVIRRTDTLRPYAL